MAKGGKPTPGGPSSSQARIPGLLALVVVGVAYQQSPYVPTQLETGLHVAVPILASLLLTQLSVRAARAVVAVGRVILDRLRDGELVLRLNRPDQSGTTTRPLSRRSRG